MDTRDRLLRRATELFNEHGLEAVGVRDLARDLDLSPGNVSYYFARKENLVAELMSDLAEANSDNVEALAAADSLPELLDQYREIFRTQYNYRFLARSVVHIVDTYPELCGSYADVDAARRKGLAQAFSRLVGTDLDASTTDSAISAIVGTCTMIARFWLSEMRLSFNHIDPELVIDHYLGVIANAAWAASSPSARASLEPYRNKVLPVVTSGAGRDT